LQINGTGPKLIHIADSVTITVNGIDLPIRTSRSTLSVSTVIWFESVIYRRVISIFLSMVKP